MGQHDMNCNFNVFFLKQVILMLICLGGGENLSREMAECFSFYIFTTYYQHAVPFNSRQKVFFFSFQVTVDKMYEESQKQHLFYNENII